MTYRKQKPETLEEKLVSMSGRVLYIPSTNQDCPSLQKLAMSLFWAGMLQTITWKTLKNSLKSAISKKAAGGSILRYTARFSIFEYVVGYNPCSEQGQAEKPAEY